MTDPLLAFLQQTATALLSLFMFSSLHVTWVLGLLKETTHELGFCYIHKNIKNINAHSVKVYNCCLRHYDLVLITYFMCVL